METKEIFANRLLEIREKQSLTRQKVADDLGITRASLEYYEKGKRTPDINIIAQIAKYFNTTTDNLFGLSDVITTNTDVKQVCEFMGMSEKAVERILNEWTNEQGVIRVAKYEDEPEIVNNIENEILCKNLLFEVAHRIFEIQNECNIASRNIKPCLSDKYKQAKEIEEHQRNIDAVLFNLSMYIVDIAKSICSRELEEFKKIDNEVNKFLTFSGSDSSDDSSEGGV